MKLKDRIAIVTGGGVGIGRAFCLALANEGAIVVAADINFKGAQAVARELEQQGKEALALRTDVADEKSTQEMARITVERFGRIDILINNAALFTALGAGRPFDTIEVEEWDRVMAINLKGLFLCARAVVPHMKAQGKGKIISISSGMALRGGVGKLHYVTSKAGVLGFTRGLARELAGQNISVNSLALGQTMSESLKNRPDVTPEVIESMKAIRCIQKSMYPEDVVGAAIFLASDDSDFICGETIVIDGGVAFI